MLAENVPDVVSRDKFRENLCPLHTGLFASKRKISVLLFLLSDLFPQLYVPRLCLLLSLLEDRKFSFEGSSELLTILNLLFEVLNLLC